MARLGESRGLGPIEWILIAILVVMVLITAYLLLEPALLLYGIRCYNQYNNRSLNELHHKAITFVEFPHCTGLIPGVLDGAGLDVPAQLCRMRRTGLSFML